MVDNTPSLPAVYRGDRRVNWNAIAVYTRLAGADRFLHKNWIAIAAFWMTQGWLGLVDGKMRMSRVVLRPHITLETGSDQAKARQLVEKAHANCFIANSVAVTVAIEPAVEFADTAGWWVP